MKGKIKKSKHLHTHAHKTQTYWPSQANNKLIWAISALCRGTKQQDQTGAAASSLRWGPVPHPIFLTPVASPFQLERDGHQEKSVTYRQRPPPLAPGADTQDEVVTESAKCLFCYKRKTVSCPCVLPRWITVWFDMVSMVTTPTPDKPLHPPPPCLSKKPPVRHYVSIQLCAQQDVSGGAGSFPEWNMVKLMLNLGKVFPTKQSFTGTLSVTPECLN